MPIDLSHIDHIGIIVDSSDKSMTFYTEVLGMEFQGKAVSKITGDTYTHLILKRKMGLDSHIELVEVSKKSPLTKAQMTKTGISHIAYRVADVESALKELETAGNAVVLKPTIIGEIKFAYVKTQDNYVFEVMEFPAKYQNSYQIKD